MFGRDTIVATILGMFSGRVDTTHQVTDPRIAVDGDTARLTALIEAQHLLTADRSKNALLKNLYDVGLVRDGDRVGHAPGRHRLPLVHRRPHRRLRPLSGSRTDPRKKRS